MARILVIDDNYSIRHVLATCLPTVGHSVSVAEDGKVGLEMASGLSTDLILLDVDMPRLGGIAVCESLKRDPTRCHIPVLMMTGNLNREVLSDAKRAGALAVLSKPFTWDQLEMEFNRYLPTGV